VSDRRPPGGRWPADLRQSTQRDEQLERASAEVQAGGFCVVADRRPDSPCILAGSAERITEQTLNEMVGLGHSLLSICLPLAQYRRLGLPKIDPLEASMRPFAAFQLVEAADGISTGISIGDRLTTIRAASRLDADETGLSEPGHVLIAPTVPGGVLAVPNAREAACDLVASATIAPVSVVSPIFSKGGSPVLSSESAAVAATLAAPLVTVEAIRRRIVLEQRTTRVA
jgi:3,4-dihydroxy-2-butanone 4-phosphate synthase